MIFDGEPVTSVRSGLITWANLFPQSDAVVVRRCRTRPTLTGKVARQAEREAAMDLDLVTWIRLNAQKKNKKESNTATRCFLIIYAGTLGTSPDICLPCPFCAAGLIPTCNTAPPTPHHYVNRSPESERIWSAYFCACICIMALVCRRANEVQRQVQS